MVAGRQATLTIDGQFYAPRRRFTLAASQGGQVLRWEEPRNRYDQLFWQAEHFAGASGRVAGLAAAAARSGAAESAGDG